MQHTESDPRAKGKRPKKGCLFWGAAAALVFFLLAGAAFACLVILDRGPGGEEEEYTLSQRMKRWKVAAMFIWYDLVDAVSRKSSRGIQSVSCPVDPPEPESDPDSAPDPESESVSAPDPDPGSSER